MRSSSFVVWVVLAFAYQARGETKCESQIRCYDQALNEKVNYQIGVELKGHYTYLYMSQIFDKHTSYYPKVAKYLRDKAAEELSHAERFIQYQNQRGGTVKMPELRRYLVGSCEDVEDLKTALKCAMELEAYVTAQLTQLHSDVSDITASTSCGEAIPDDDLRLTQPMLVTCKLDGAPGGTAAAPTSNWKGCDCSTITSVAYVELAEMIAHDFLGHQVEDTKEIANYYRTVKKLTEGDDGSDRPDRKLGEFLFDKHLEL